MHRAALAWSEGAKCALGVKFCFLLEPCYKPFPHSCADSAAVSVLALPAAQINLRDAVRGTVSYEDPNTGKKYALKEGKRAIMVCRPRGWHLWEHHVLVDGQAVPGEPPPCVMLMGRQAGGCTHSAAGCKRRMAGWLHDAHIGTAAGCPPPPAAAPQPLPAAPHVSSCR